MVSAALHDRTLGCLKEVVSDNEYYRARTRLSCNYVRRLGGVNVIYDCYEFLGTLTELSAAKRLFSTSSSRGANRADGRGSPPA